MLLPSDIILLLFDYLDATGLSIFSRVCKYYRSQVVREETWKAKAGIRGKVAADAFMSETNRKRLPVAYIRYFVLSLEVGGVFIPGVEKYVNSQLHMKCLAERAPDATLLEMHESKPQLVCYGIYKSERHELLGKLGINPHLEIYWGATLDALVANDNVDQVKEFLTYQFDNPFTLPLNPLTSAFDASDAVWQVILEFYTGHTSPKYRSDVVRMAFTRGRIDRCKDILATLSDGLDEKTHVHLLGVMKTNTQFEFYVSILSTREQYLRALYFFIENDCRTVEWLATLEEKITFIPIGECLGIASEKDNVNYYKYLIRRGSIKLSDIIVNLNTIIFKKNSLVFLTMNRHPDMPPVILANLRKFHDDEIKRYLLPYVLDKSKKKIDDHKLELFAAQYPKALYYVTKP